MRIYDLLAGVALAVLSLWIYGVSAGFPAGAGGTPGPGLYPRLISVVLILLAVLLIAKALLAKGDWGKIIYRPEVWRVFLAIALIGGFVFLWARTRFEVATILYLFAMVNLYGKISLKRSLIYSVVVAGSIYLLFGLALGVPLELGV